VSLERALAPLAVFVAAAAVGTWLLLVNDVWLGPWLLALLVFFHGWVHLLFVFPKPESPNAAVGGSEYPFDFERSWLIRRGMLEAGLVRRVGLVVMIVVFVLGVAAALATVGVLVPVAWWGAAMVGCAIASAVLLALFFSPALILGFVIDALMVALVASGTWSPST
jgi:hypothetical protein